MTRYIVLITPSVHDLLVYLANGFSIRLDSQWIFVLLFCLLFHCMVHPHKGVTSNLYVEDKSIIYRNICLHVTCEHTIFLCSFCFVVHVSCLWFWYFYFIYSPQFQLRETAILHLFCIATTIDPFFVSLHQMEGL